MPQPRKAKRARPKQINALLEKKLAEKRELERQVKLNQRVSRLARELRAAMSRADRGRLELLGMLATDGGKEVVDRHGYMEQLDQLRRLRNENADLAEQLERRQETLAGARD